MITVRKLSELEKVLWDREVQNFAHVHPHNSYEWCQIKAGAHWDVAYYVAEQNKIICGAMPLLFRKIPFTPFTVMSCPRGPLWHADDWETFEALIIKAKEVAKNKRTIFLRIDPNIPEGNYNGIVNSIVEYGFKRLNQRWTFWNAPSDDLRVDLTKYKNSDEYFLALKKRTRYSIRKASKQGIKIQRGFTNEDFNQFVELYYDFATEKGFLTRGKPYQQKIWSRLIGKEKGRLFLAFKDSEIIGGGTALIFGNKYLGLHLGTRTYKKRFYTSYALTWADLKCAIDIGCDWFSFGGASSTSQEYFKNKFLPEKIALIGYFDLVFIKILYKLCHFSEFSLLPILASFYSKAQRVMFKFLIPLKRFIIKLPK